MLEIRHLVRKFGDLVAVDDVSFTVRPGVVTGFVGGNGAGKTTAMRMILGVLAPTSGEVLWNGEPITREVRASFGYMPEERGLFPKQSVLTQLVFLGELHGMSSGDARAAAIALLERFGLHPRAKDKLESLSLGNQQRVQIAAAVLADPIGLVLDEPFSGLDPKAVDEMFAILSEYVARDVPVLFSSHQLDLVEHLADHVVVLSSGRVIADGSVEDLVASAISRHHLCTDTDLGWLRDLSQVTEADVHGTEASFVLAYPGAGQDVLAEALRRGRVRSFGPVVPTLSEVYRGVTA
ncbi:MAG: ATP-binding cassette domain-containing protein [Propionibacteriaceae bacterium]|nr:ATP-binding cassette domain-containing protein [Propionibacteriaceae bacterium]